MGFKGYYTLKIFSFSSGSKSTNIKVPAVIFWSFLWAALIVLVLLGFFSSKVIMANYSLYSLQKENAHKEKELAMYGDFYKDYFTRFEAVNFYLENKFLISDNLGKVPKSIGGGTGLNFNLDEIKKDKILSKQLNLRELPIEQIISFLPQNIEPFEESLDLVKKVNSSISLANGNSLRFIPFLLPAFKSDFKSVVDRGNYVILKLNPESEIISAANGRAVRVSSHKANSFSIVLEHGFAIKTYYEGLKDVSVAKEQEVSKGEVVGVSDDEFIIYRIKIGNQFVSPLDYIISAK